jgi:hypothetical protein
LKNINELISSIRPSSFNNRFLKFYFPIAITSAFSICIIIGMYYHELWRDEIDVYAGLYYSHLGGPQIALGFQSLIYYSFMQCIVKLIPSFTTFQVCHFIIIVAAIYVFNRFSPFDYFQKFLFTFSYFMLFEYGIIARWYGLFILLLFIITYLLTKEKKNYIIISVLLVILANHNISSAIFATSLAVYMLIHAMNSFQTKVISSQEKKNIIISFIILGAGSILIFSQYIYVWLHPIGNVFKSYGYPPFFMTLRTVWTSYIPIPDFSLGAAFWNTNIIHYPVRYPQNYNMSVFLTASNILTVIISIIFIIICLIVFSRKPPVLLTYIVNMCIYFIFIHCIFRFHLIRHLGLLFIIFVYCSWLYKYSDNYINIGIPGFKFSKSLKGFPESKFTIILFSSFITIIFLFQFIAGVLTYPKDIKYKFTKSWDTANYIKNNNYYDDYILVGAVDYAVQPIAAILNRDIYFPQINKFSKTSDYSSYRKNDVSPHEIITDSVNLLNIYNKNVLIILNNVIKDSNGTPIIIEKITNNIILKRTICFGNDDIIQRDESYCLYELTKAY